MLCMQSAGPVRLGLDVRPSTAGAGRAGAAAVLVLQRVCVAHAAMAARVVAHAGVVTHAGVDRRRRDGG